MITTTYEIVNLVCEQKIEGKPDAISGAQIKLTASDGNKSTSSVVFVPIHVNYDSENFTSFDQLDEATVKSWIDQQTQLMNNYKFQVKATLKDITEPSSLTKLPAWKQQEQSQPLEVITYETQRRLSYPSLGEQFDMLWHAMDSGEIPHATNFYNRIKAVKDQYPKS